LSAVSVIEAKDSESRKLRSRKRHDAWIKANDWLGRILWKIL